VRGVGLIAAVEIVKDKSTKIQFDPSVMMAAQVAKRTEAHGLIVRALTGDVIAFSPPMIIEANEIEEMLGAFGHALEETWAWVRAQGLIDA
jgi:4-aminobutyrate--pyruvate transaminase